MTSQVVTVAGINRSGDLDILRGLTKPASRLVTLRRIAEGRYSRLAECIGKPIPQGMGDAEYRAICIRNTNSVLPPIMQCDYDLPDSLHEHDSSSVDGELPWFVGGNVEGQLGTLPDSGYYFFGTDPTTGAAGVSGVDLGTNNRALIRINGDASNDLVYQESQDGRVFIANGMLGTKPVPVVSNVVALDLGEPTEGVPPLVDLYLERPSNVYNFTVDQTLSDQLVTASDPPFTDLVALYSEVEDTQILFVNNILLGDLPTSAPSFIADYPATSGAASGVVVPDSTQNGQFGELGLDSFNYLLKFINTSAEDVSLFFQLPGAPTLPLTVANPPRFNTMNTSIVPILIPAGGAAFLTMRVEKTLTHSMIASTVFETYTEP